MKNNNYLEKNILTYISYLLEQIPSCEEDSRCRIFASFSTSKVRKFQKKQNFAKVLLS